MNSIKCIIIKNLKKQSKVLSVGVFAIASSLMFSVASAADLKELPSGEYTLDKSHASVIWSVSHLGLSPYYARFTDFDIDLTLDTADMAKSTVTATVNPASVSTENTKFDAKLISEKWFNPAKYAAITFESSSYTPLTDTTAKLAGSIEMFGISKPVEFDVTLGGAIASHPFKNDTVAVGFEATTVIKRSDWGFSKYIPSVGDEVTLHIAAEFFRQNTTKRLIQK